MSTNPIHVGVAGDADRFLATDQTVWFPEVPAAPTEVQLLGLAPGQRFAAEIAGCDRGPYPGIYGVYPMSLSVPAVDGARLVPCAGLTWVGVHPDHRRRGVLTAMLRDHFERVHAEAGTHVSALHASEPAIYGRHGYGLASLELQVTLGRGTRFTAPRLDDAAAAVGTAMVTVTDADVPARIQAAHRTAAELGAVVGDAGYYARVCHQTPEHNRGKEPWRVLFAERDGEDAGFALFRRNARWQHARPAGELEVWALVGDPAVRLALLRRLVDFDLVATVKVIVGVDDPLLSWVGGPRSLGTMETYDNLWVRLVDLPEALQDRAWSAPCDVVVQVTDTAAPWNDGTWRIHAADGAATVERSSAEPDVHLRVDALGAAYLGGGNLSALHRAGLVAEQRRGAVAELARAMRTDVAPSVAVGF